MPFQSMIRHGLIITLNVITGTSALRREIFYLDEYADRGIRPISGVDLTLNRDMTFLGDTDQYGQLTCRAIGNDVTINSVTVSWVNLTGESVDLLRVTTNRPARTVSLDGMLGNGTLQGNTGYIFIHQVDAAACDTSYFLCEVNFTKQSGESGRAFAAAWPRQIQSSQPTHASLEEKLSDLSAAFGKLNQSYTSLLRDLREGQRLNANISAKTTELEGRLSSQICDPCSNLTDSLEDVKRRLELLDISNTPTGDGDGGDTTNTPTGDGDGDYTTNTPTGDGDDDDTTNTPTGGGDGDDTTNTPAGGGDGTDTTNTPTGGGDGGDTTNTPTGGGDGGDTTNTPTGGGDGDDTTNTPTGGGDGTDTTNTPTGGGDGDDTTNTSTGDGDGDDTTNTPTGGGDGGDTMNTPTGVVEEYYYYYDY